MALVGTHLLRKTLSQPAWVWGTFEHNNNAPDCEGLPEEGNGQANKTCPTTVSQQWNFYPQECSTGGADPDACAACNTGYDPMTADALAENGMPAQCVTPDAMDGASWCLDQPPATIYGKSRLCRQIPYDSYYAGATSWDDTPPNAACQPDGTVWANYQLISTQWATGLTNDNMCPNVQDQVFTTNVMTDLIEPKVELSSESRPFLGNTSMESYERSNCMGCHSKSTVNETADALGTDFVYFLGLEVPAFEPAP